MSDPAEFLDGIVHEGTQVTDRGVDLTLGAVYEVTEPGQADFGGDEYAEPGVEQIEPEKRAEDDDYGWWELDGGRYLLEHNETLASESVAFVCQPHERLLPLGVSHPTAHVNELDRFPLSVSAGGVALKENARVSTLLPRDR